MGSFLVLLSALGFSALGIFGKFAYQAGFSMHQFLFWRFLLALPFYVGVLFLLRALPTREEWQHPLIFMKATALGLFGIGIEASLFFLTLKEVGAALTAILLYLYPAFVALISHFFLKQKLTSKEWLCILLSLLGCALTVDLLHLGTASARVSSVGFLYGILTALCYSIYLLVGSKMSQKHQPLTLGAWVTLGSMLCFFLLTLNDLAQGGTFRIPFGGAEWGLLLGMAVISTVLPFSTFFVGMKKIGPTRTAILSTMEMVFTLVLAAFFFGEKLTFTQYLGAFLILLSVLLIQRAR